MVEVKGGTAAKNRERKSRHCMQGKKLVISLSCKVVRGGNQ